MADDGTIGVKDPAPSGDAEREAKPWPDPAKVRRVRVEEPGDPHMQRQLAERLARQRIEEDDDGR
jgi:hypothetical protein